MMRSIVFLIFWIAWTTPSAASLAGWISSSHPKGCYEIKSSGVPSSWLSLATGDQIVISDNDCTVFLMADPCCIKITQANSPYTVEAPREQSPFARLIKALLPHGLFTNGSKQEVQAGNIRGVVAPVLEGSTQVAIVRAGRVVVFPTASGVAPFTFRVASFMGKNVCEGASESPRLACRITEGAQGLWLGEIRDNTAGEPFTFRLRAVQPAEATCLAAVVASKQETGHSLIEALQTALDTAMCGSFWRLEAYQYLVPYLDNDAMARRLRDYIQQGAIRAYGR